MPPPRPSARERRRCCRCTSSATRPTCRPSSGWPRSTGWASSRTPARRAARGTATGSRSGGADSGGEVRGGFVFVVQLPPEVDRDETVRVLASAGVQSKPYLPAIHLMSFYRERFGHREGEFPLCEEVAARSLALPFFPQMSDGQVERVAAELRGALRSGALRS